MEKLTVSLDTARKLKEVGFPQNTILEWFHSERYQDPQGNTSDTFRVGITGEAGLFPVPERLTRRLAAPTAQELADELQSARPDVPITITIGGTAMDWDVIPDTYARQGNEPITKGDDIAHALAALWIKLNTKEGQ